MKAFLKPSKTSTFSGKVLSYLEGVGGSPGVIPIFPAFANPKAEGKGILLNMRQ